MYNIQGELVFEEKLKDPTFQGEFRLSRGNLISGVYLLKISGSDWSEIKKVFLM
jgi:hypothetical protein